MRPDELTPLERQLAACRPSTAGLDADAMLFAAGRAVDRPDPARFVWPALACGFAVLSLALAGGLVRERSERLAMADRFDRPDVAIAQSPIPTTTALPLPGPDSYLAARRLVEQDADDWFAHADDGPLPAEPPVRSPTIHAWPGVSADLPP